jgi:hypothetical protein
MQRRYETSLVPICDLPEDTIMNMSRLYLENYDGTSETIFRDDLAEKDEAILLFCDERLVGFTTLKVYEAMWHSKPIRVVYSGDTIVNPQNWDQQKLTFAWISRIGKIKQSAPTLPLYWFLLVKGHRTYKYLSVFCNSFYPHWTEFRADLKSLADQLAGARFGNDYYPETGIISFPVSRGHLKAEIANASREEMNKASTRYFSQKNPNYLIGNELVCICELEEFNMKPMAARIFRRSFETLS